MEFLIVILPLLIWAVSFYFIINSGGISEKIKIPCDECYINYIKENKKFNKYGYASFYKFLEYYHARSWEFEKNDILFDYMSTDGRIKYYKHDSYPSIVVSFCGYRMIMRSEEDYKKLVDFLNMKINNVKAEIKEW